MTAARLWPLPADKAALLRQLVDGLSPSELCWLSGYAAGLGDQTTSPQVALTQVPLQDAAAPTTAASPRVTILYGTQGGNARAVAEKLQVRLHAQGQVTRLVRASDYGNRELKDEQRLLVVVSTQGDGDPPEDARAFYDFVCGKRAPSLPTLRFAILGLGDSTYPKFNHSARVLDDRLAALGAVRLCARGECDVDFAGVAASWSSAVGRALEEGAPALLAEVRSLRQAHCPPGGPSAARPSVVDVVAPIPSGRPPSTARVLVNQRLTARGAKDTRHIELQGDDLHVVPGDALGVWPENPPCLVDELLGTLGASGEDLVSWGGKSLPLSRWFSRELEITRVTPALQQAHRARGGDDTPSWQVIDVVRCRPSLWTATDLIAQLRPLMPRLYSVAASQLRCPGEVHLTVAHVDIVVDGRRRVGAASHFLCTRKEDTELRVFVERNDAFRLPDDDIDIVMIGPGTGVAPFRAFLQERQERGARGRNWLFFGEQSFSSTFLYQLEWQEAVKRGTLHKIDLAFSRDQASKIYVQQRIRERAAELWAWLQGGAAVYVCGDAKHMAPDVETALLEVARTQGRLDEDDVADWLSTLRQQHRYRRDIY